MQKFKVHFKPQNKSIVVEKGTDLLTAAIKAGVAISAACGGEGLCGKCKVSIGRNTVMACQTLVESDLSVDVPKSSTESHAAAKHESEDFTKGVISEREKGLKLAPIIRKIYVELSEPTQDDNTDDLERILRAVEAKIAHARISTKLSNIKHLSENLRDNAYKVTAVIAYEEGLVEMLAVEPGDTTDRLYGFAFDIGTTTVAGQLIDLNSGEILGTRIAFNKQSSYGSDVITRIIYASNPNGLLTLSKAVLSNIADIIDDLSDSCRVNLSVIYAAVLAGNMTMMHLLLKIDPANIRKAPYIPAATQFGPINAREVGININQRAAAVFLPGVSTYVGGDTIAGLLACGLPDNPELTLLIDIGTNGEIVLGNSEWMMGAAASAGPAFEGSGLECGMKAVKGAIQKAEIDQNFITKVETVWQEKPRGICGSGYIDILCQLLKRNIITKDGKINRSIKSSMVRNNGVNYEFVLVPKETSATGKDIVITEDDIENIKRSKGAIYSAIMSLLNKVEKKTSDIKKIYIAGGFGNYLNIENSIYIGLLPDIDRNIYEFIGNSSLAGARMVLLSRDLASRADAIRKNVTYLDLSGEPNYMDEYVASLFFPHTDMGRFPSAQ